MGLDPEPVERLDRHVDDTELDQRLVGHDQHVADAQLPDGAAELFARIGTRENDRPRLGFGDDLLLDEEYGLVSQYLVESGHSGSFLRFWRAPGEPGGAGLSVCVYDTRVTARVNNPGSADFRVYGPVPDITWVSPMGSWLSCQSRNSTSSRGVVVVPETCATRRRPSVK